MTMLDPYANGDDEEVEPDDYIDPEEALAPVAPSVWHDLDAVFGQYVKEPLPRVTPEDDA